MSDETTSPRWGSPLHGLFAYTLQGVIHAQHLDNQNYFVPPTPHTVRVGRGDTAKADSWPGYDVPVLTAFYPTEYPPPPVPPPKSAQPTLQGSWGPTFSSPPFVPTVGYYPYSETGYFIFDKNWTLKGGLRVNTGGYSGDAFYSTFEGGYGFDVSAFHNLNRIPMGVITIQFDKLKTHVWDYSFVMVSDEEAQLMAGGRLPRPGVSTGLMRKIQTSAYLYRRSAVADAMDRFLNMFTKKW